MSGSMLVVAWGVMLVLATLLVVPGGPVVRAVLALTERMHRSEA